jgi:nicotinate-nucleotide pyrophosphorylase (carboxylating)
MTLKQYYKIHSDEIDKLIHSALREDKARIDITTEMALPEVKKKHISSADLVCKEDCILAGIDVFKRVFKLLDKNVSFKQYKEDGERVHKKDIVLKIRASVKTLLSGERTALNFLQRMCGIATLTNEFVNRLRFKSAKILHTRKTTPNFRVFEIAAVKIGGGQFHRFDLSSAVMIKDNHIVTGSLEVILKRIQKLHKKTNISEKFEVEVKNLFELGKILQFGSDFVKIVMLDNFSPGDIEQAAILLKKHDIKIEISGGITPDNFDKYQNPHVDFYSIGMLTHSYNSVDFSLEF